MSWRACIPLVGRATKRDASPPAHCGMPLVVTSNQRETQRAQRQTDKVCRVSSAKPVAEGIQDKGLRHAHMLQEAAPPDI